MVQSIFNAPYLLAFFAHWKTVLTHSVCVLIRTSVRTYTGASKNCTHSVIHVGSKMAAKGNTLSPEMQPKRAALEASNFESIFNYVPSFPGKPTFGSQGQKSPHN